MLISHLHARPEVLTPADVERVRGLIETRLRSHV
jgi:hypothetical protein